jgi:hypothetical protein
MSPPERPDRPRYGDVVLRIVIYADDSDNVVLEQVIDSITETASVLPNTKSDLNDEGTRLISIVRGDAYRWPHIVDKLVNRVEWYEDLVAQRDAGIDLEAYYEPDAEWRSDDDWS